MISAVYVVGWLCTMIIGRSYSQSLCGIVAGLNQIYSTTESVTKRFYFNGSNSRHQLNMEKPRSGGMNPLISS